MVLYLIDMLKFLSVCFFLFCSVLFAQTKITVLDGFLVDQPLENVVVLDTQNFELGQTNANGIFTVPDGIEQVILVFEGYKDRKLFLYGKDITVELHPHSVELQETLISSDDSEARALIREIIKNKDKNSLENLKSYEFKTYTKFLATASPDSMPYILFPKNERDSAYNDMRKLLDKSHLMLGERAIDHKFSDQYGKKDIVRTTRISGITTPLYEFVAMQPISTNFYDEKLRLFTREYINPVSERGLKEYRYRILDKVEQHDKTTIDISFFPKKRKNVERQIKGRVSIDNATKAITGFHIENLSDERVAELDMNWIPFKGYWIPDRQRFRMDAGHMSYPAVRDSILPDGTLQQDSIKKKEKVWLHVSTTFQKFESPVEFDKNEFKGYESEIDFKGMDNPDEILKNYREEALTAREENTYEKIDSIGKKYKMDRNIRLLRLMSTGGNYEIGKYNIDVTKLVRYNKYEGFRLGFGGSTNYKFSDEFSLNGYIAYGFKDKKPKFGFGVDRFVNKPWSGRIFMNLTNDVEVSGRNLNVHENNFQKFINGFLNYSNVFYYRYRQIQGGYEQDLFQNMTFRISGIYNERKALFDYRFKDFRSDENFLSFDTQLALRWAPKEKFVRTPYGKVTIQGGYPVFYLTATQGWNVFNSDGTPTKLELTYKDYFRTFLGRTHLQINSGLVIGESPIFNLFEGHGNGASGDKILQRFDLAGTNSFETMLPGEFYSDQFAMLEVSQLIFGFKLFKQNIFPEFIYRGLIGKMKNPEHHQFIEFGVPSKYYQEAGLEFNQLMLGIVGIGAYYRLGNYAHGSIDKDLFLKATLSFSFL